MSFLLSSWRPAVCFSSSSILNIQHSIWETSIWRFCRWRVWVICAGLTAARGVLLILSRYLSSCTALSSSSKQRMDCSTSLSHGEIGQSWFGSNWCRTILSCAWWRSTYLQSWRPTRSLQHLRSNLAWMHANNRRREARSLWNTSCPILRLYLRRSRCKGV